MNAARLRGGVTGVDWLIADDLRQPVDPYFVWFDCTNKRHGPQQVSLDLIVEVDKNRFDQVKNCLMDWGARIRFDTIGGVSRPSFLTIELPAQRLALLQSSIETGMESVFRGYELASPRQTVSSTPDPADPLQLPLTVVDRQAIEALLPETFRTGPRISRGLPDRPSDFGDLFTVATPVARADAALPDVLQWLAPVTPNRQFEPTQPMVVVVDDFCNFASPHLLGRLSTLWDQGRTKPSGSSSGGDPWIYQPAPASSRESTEVDATASGGRESGREKYGAILDFEGSWGTKLAVTGDELDPYRQAAYPKHGLYRLWSHGSAVLHAIAGAASPVRWCDPDDSRSAARPRGLHFVQLPDDTVFDTSGGSLAAFAIDALHRAARRAAHAEHPPSAVIVCMSYGTHSGPHDGTSMFERAMLEMLDVYDGINRPALHIVLPAGNSHWWRVHAGAQLARPGSSACVRWRVLPDNDADSFIELWFPEGAIAKVTVSEPQGSFTLACKPGQTSVWASSRADGTETWHAALIFPKRTPRGQKGTMALLALGPTQRLAHAADPAISGARILGTGKRLGRVPLQSPPGVWTIAVENSGSKAFDFHAWVQRSDAAPGRSRSAKGHHGRQSYLLDPDPADSHQSVRPGDSAEVGAEPRYTLNGIATASHAGQQLWVVGAMEETGRLSLYSSAGPDRRTGARTEGPDVLTIVDRSRCFPGRLVGGVLSGTRLRLAGTSIAAAVYTRLLHYGLSRRKVMVWTAHGPAPDGPPRRAGEPQSASGSVRGHLYRLEQRKDID